MKYSNCGVNGLNGLVSLDQFISRLRRCHQIRKILEGTIFFYSDTPIFYLATLGSHKCWVPFMLLNISNNTEIPTKDESVKTTLNDIFKNVAQKVNY